MHVGGEARRAEQCRQALDRRRVACPDGQMGGAATRMADLAWTKQGGPMAGDTLDCAGIAELGGDDVAVAKPILQGEGQPLRRKQGGGFGCSGGGGMALDADQGQVKRSWQRRRIAGGPQWNHSGASIGGGEPQPLALQDGKLHLPAPQEPNLVCSQGRQIPREQTTHRPGANHYNFHVPASRME